MVNRNEEGQSLVEVVFAVGVIIVVLTAVLSLLVTSLRSRTQGFDRKKAAELGQKVVEQLVEEKNQDENSFWNIGSTFWAANNGITQTMSGYPNYNYTIGFTQVVGAGGNCPGTAAAFVCANATIGVGWSGNIVQNVVFTRFFSK
jgi:Tfp pilus assembly protein PilV